MNQRHSKVKVWTEDISIPTYRRGPEDRNPPLFIGRKNPIHPGSSIIYPYPMQDNLTDTREEKKWLAVFLENEFLCITILPQLGGHVLSVLDKVTDEDAIYRNHVLKFNRIGIRGAWVSGGIEWNFPNGHTVTTSSPVDYAIQKNADGSRTVLISDIERVSRMKWSVGITLYPGRAFFETKVRLFNRTALPNRFWFWANSAVPASKGLEFITTASKVMTLTDVMDFPVHEGVDIRWDKNHLAAQDLFSLNPWGDFVAWYNHDLHRGMVNHADSFEARGKKFFTWGNSDAGLIWTDLLTDDDGPYAEMQSGRLRTMRIWEILSPFSVESWKEVWYPIRAIGSPVYANRDVCLSYMPHKEKGFVRIGVQATVSEHDVEISIRKGKKTIWTERTDLDPGSPYIREVRLKPAQIDVKDTVIRITSELGAVIAEWNGSTAADETMKEYYKIEPKKEACTAEEISANAAAYEKLGDSPLAEHSYRQALCCDPGHTPSRLGLGVLALRSGLLDEAAGEFELVLARDENNPEARFFLGVCYMLGEEFDSAIGELLTLSRSRSLADTGAYILGGLYLGRGQCDRAILYIEKALSLHPQNLDARALLSCAWRKRGDAERALSCASAVLDEDPTNIIALAEAYFASEQAKNGEDCDKNLSRIKKTLRGEVQSYLELSYCYTGFGLWDEGIRVLLTLSADPGTDDRYPMLDYCLGYFHHKKGDAKEARRYAMSGGEKDPSFVFPHRLESERILRWVIEVSPKDGKAKYYLGNLLASRGREKEAVRLWEDAKRDLKSFSVLHRNLGRAYWLVENDPDRALKEYEKAFTLSPEDYRIYYELDTLYASFGLTQKRGKLAVGVHEELRGNDIVEERRASYCTDAGEYDAALKILGATKFFPWEFYTEGRRLYEAANFGKGLQFFSKGKYTDAIESFKAVMKYPRNIGVGKPAKKGHAEALYRIGLALERLEKKHEALESYRLASEEEHTDWNELRYYEAKAKQRLGEKKPASMLFDGLLISALEGLEGPGLEGPGLSEEGKARFLYLAGLACKGKGNTLKANSFFSRTLAHDPSHRRSRWELEGFVKD